MKKIKTLNSNEIDCLINGIENGDIVIGGGKSLTPEELSGLKKQIKKHSDTMTPEDKEHIIAFAEKLIKEDNEKEK